MSNSIKNLKLAYIKLTKKVFTIIDELPDEKLQDIILGRYEIKINFKDNKTKKEESKLNSTEVKFIVDKLSSFNNREEGFSFLKDKKLKKNDLEFIARFIDLPIQREDTINKLITKIVESTIGFRIRSEAIQR